MASKIGGSPSPRPVSRPSPPPSPSRSSGSSSISSRSSSSSSVSAPKSKPKPVSIPTSKPVTSPKKPSVTRAPEGVTPPSAPTVPTARSTSPTPQISGADVKSAPRTVSRPSSPAPQSTAAPASQSTAAPASQSTAAPAPKAAPEASKSTPVAPEGADIREAQLDLTKPVSVRTVKGAIDAIANERGESGGLDFHIEGSAKVYGPVEAGAWGNLGLKVAKSDTGGTSLSFNYEAAAKAGLDLGAFNVEGAVGMNGRVKARFNNSADAAAWLTQNLHNINKKADGQLFNIQGSRFNYSQPTIVKENGVFAEGRAKAKFGPFEVQGKARGQSTSQQFMTPDGKTYQGRETSLQAGVGGQMDFGKLKVNGEYQFNQFTQSGDPVTENNGTYRNHKVSFNVPLKELQQMSPDQIRDAVIGLATMNTEALSPLGQAGHQKMLDGVVNNLEHIKKNPPKGGLNANIGISYEAQNVKEGDKYNNQYQRIFLDLQGGLKGEFDAKVARGEVSLQASKSELLKEWVGAQTESYAQQVYNRSLDPNGRRPDWTQFKQDNRGALEQMVQNRIAQDPNGAVARAYGKGNVDAGVRALEQQWGQRAQVDDRLRRDAAQLANFGNQFHFSGSEEAQALRILDRYRNKPHELTKMISYMETLGVDRNQIYGKTGGMFSNHDERMKAHFERVDQFIRTMKRQGHNLDHYFK